MGSITDAIRVEILSVSRGEERGRLVGDGGFEASKADLGCNPSADMAPGASSPDGTAAAAAATGCKRAAKDALCGGSPGAVASLQRRRSI